MFSQVLLLAFISSSTATAAASAKLSAKVRKGLTFRQSAEGPHDAETCASIKRQAVGVVSGILMGISARMAGGCNIGGFFGGLSSGSWHGWLWFAAGLAGTIASSLLRPHVGLALEPREIDFRSVGAHKA